MNTDRWRQLEDLFAEALTRSPEERASFLDEACGGDAALQAELHSLLAAYEESPTYLETRPGGAMRLAEAMLPAADETGRIGPYQLLRRIGQGGMGEVYHARRDDAYRQDVAIKVIRRGMDTEDLLNRFRTERQILASLNHPNIARVLDGGTTPDGRPYVVMEFIEGQPIDRYCDEQSLSVSKRLELFQTVCRAVQYAHQNLVVHRDLKPSNILVTDAGVVKLLDFGIAKLLDPQVTLDPIPVTRTHMRLMTPEYASPEQVRGEAITTVSDVYALGVVLYELLTGHRPYVVPTKLSEIERVICEAQPERPSTAVSRVEAQGGEAGGGRSMTADQISRARGTQTDRLRRRLSGDLDNIVLMAMRKEPGRRYASAEQLADDVQKHLAGLPVLARPDTFSYRTQKFVRRHRIGVAAAALVAALLVGFTAVTAVQSVKIRDQALQVARERDKAEEVVSLFIDLFDVSDPFSTEPVRGDTIEVRAFLEAAEEKVQNELDEQPAVKAKMVGVLGDLYRNLGNYERAEVLSEESLEMHRALGDDEPLELVASLNGLAILLREKGEYEAAEALYREAMDVIDALPEREHTIVAECLNNYALLLRTVGKYEAAEPLYREALSTRRTLLGDDDTDLGNTLNNLALLMRDTGRYKEARPLYEEALAIMKAALGEEHPSTAITAGNLALVLHEMGDYAAAEPLYRQVLATKRARLGETHPSVAPSLNNLAGLLRDTGAYEESEALYRQTLRIVQETMGERHPFVAFTQTNIAKLMAQQGRFAESEPLYQEALLLARATLPADHPAVANVLVGLGQLYLAQGRTDGVEAMVQEALTTRLAKHGETDWRTAEAKSTLGACFLALGQYDRAETMLKEAYPILRDVRGTHHVDTRTALQNFVNLYEAWGRPDEAVAYRRLLLEPGDTRSG